MSSTSIRLLRGAVGLVVVAVLLVVVSNWVGDYRGAKKTTPSQGETSVTPAPGTKEGSGGTKPQEASPADTGTPKATYVVVMIDGLNFRESPEQNATTIRGLDKGTRLLLLQERAGWYEVRAEDGTTGWLSGNPTYTKLEK